MSTTTTESRKLYFRLLRYVRPYLAAFIISIIFMVLLGLSDAAVPALLKPLFDGGFIEKDLDSLQQTLVLLVLLFLIRGISHVVSTGTMGWVSGKIVLDIRKQMFAHLLDMPTRYYDTNATGNTLSKITFNVNQVTQAATRTLTILIRDTVTALGLLAVALYLNWQLTIAILVAFPPVVIVAQLFARRMRSFSHAHQDKTGDMTHVLEESMRGHKVVKVFGGKKYENKRFFNVANKVRQFQQKVLLAGAANVAVVELITSVVLCSIVYIGTLQAIDQGQTAGHLISFFAALGLMISPIKRLASAMQPLQRGLAAAESIFKLIDEEREKDNGTQALARSEGVLALENVSFSYSSDKAPALHQISFTAAAGETIALVGQSGSGKSTIASLLPRFYDPTSGHIFLDGHDLRDLRLADLRKQISYVSQDVVLFNDTIRANISYGSDTQADEAQIIAAAKAAHAWEFIQEMPQQLNTLVGENGIQLSGGQRQRIAIARALLKNAPLLILDEATSALDSRSESLVQEAIENLRHGRTTIIIAHRLSTVENADRILVLDQGHLVEQGSHTELLALDGRYAALYGNLQ
ncbi:lipid A export permease/ATP-binding protein MsbA [Solemya elarraichensis gill symbiont]|uniref:Lipid A export permease/ATP-binding protein MsbA n=1 Tax=Solemya elarraichensis gill symbiont TaxID=1918949 RepID=A0A1T2LCV7_9GAMM|nr:lipid A export permease/ATP-binding protein MsbA [Solemya elarraichensis gill symbiont]OOZ42923.1 lipid A export permease/ATP-binding protein MsbA [Solemya elarraichensis gill symbiont]